MRTARGTRPDTNQRPPPGREAIPRSHVLQLLFLDRLLDPGSEFRLYPHGLHQTARAYLPGAGFALASPQPPRPALPVVGALAGLLYDPKSTDLAGKAKEFPPAKRGQSRDGRPACLPVVIGLGAATAGFPLAYAVVEGHLSDKTKRQDFLVRIDSMYGKAYGKARRVWVCRPERCCGKCAGPIRRCGI